LGKAEAETEAETAETAETETARYPRVQKIQHERRTTSQSLQSLVKKTLPPGSKSLGGFLGNGRVLDCCKAGTLPMSITICHSVPTSFSYIGSSGHLVACVSAELSVLLLAAVSASSFPKLRSHSHCVRPCLVKVHEPPTSSVAFSVCLSLLLPNPSTSSVFNTYHIRSSPGSIS
jgi:hypothetical protein